MKSKLTKGIIFLVIMSLFLACNTKTADPEVVVADKEQIKKEIQDKEDEYASIYNSGELKNIGYYADDATIFAQNRTPIVGRDAIIDYLKVDVEFNTDKISFTTREIFPSANGNMVLEIGHYQVVDSTNTPINTGNYMCLFEKRDGNYYCIREMSTSDLPLQ